MTSVLLYVHSLLMTAVATQSGIFEGPPEALTFTHSVRLLSEGMYYNAGRLVALSLSQGGPGLQCMSQAVCRYWLGLPVSDDLLTIDMVADVDIRTRIQSVCCSLTSVVAHMLHLGSDG